MKRIVYWLLVSTIFFSFLTVSPVFGIHMAGIPGIVGFVSGTDGLSTGSMSSSSVEFSSDTLIMTGGAPKPTQAPPPAVMTGPGAGMIIVPPQWIKANAPGAYYDPVTDTVWIYDPVFLTYFAPKPNWFLIVKRNAQGIPEGFFYYDVKGKKLYNSMTGAVITTSSPGGTSGTDSGTGESPGGPTPSGNTGTTEPSGPIIAAGVEETPVSGTGEQTPGSQNGEPCLVPCNTCPSGYCHDCNNNGSCDEEESGSSAEGETEVAGGMSEDPQHPIQPTQTPIQISGGTSEGPQNPIQINNPIEIPEGGSDQMGVEGGQSENPQGTVLYMLAGGKGPFKVLACSGDENCIYCVDNNKDELCSETDCHLIFCEQGEGCTYCLDCNHDGICDQDKIILVNCTENEPCETIDYCDDINLDGSCDIGGPDIPEYNLLNVDLLKPDLPLEMEVIPYE